MCSGHRSYLSLLKCLFLALILTLCTGWTHARLDDDVELISNLSKEDAVELLRELHYFRSALKLRFPNLEVSPARPLRIIFTEDRDEYEELVSEVHSAHFSAGGVSSTNLIRSMIVGRVALKSDAAMRLLFHEYIHALLQNYERIPTVLEEGFAEYCSTFGSKDGAFVLGEVKAEHLVRVRAVQWMLLIAHSRYCIRLKHGCLFITSCVRMMRMHANCGPV